MSDCLCCLNWKIIVVIKSLSSQGRRCSELNGLCLKKINYSEALHNIWLN